jgi:hypothetical protein
MRGPTTPQAEEGRAPGGGARGADCGEDDQKNHEHAEEPEVRQLLAGTEPNRPD